MLLVAANLHDMYVYTSAVFIHFLFSALAIGALLSVDLKFVKNYHNPLTPDFLKQMGGSGKLIAAAIPVLWVTGVYFVMYGAWIDGGYLANQKLIFKCVVVSIISLNGILLGMKLRGMRVGDVIANYSGFSQVTMLVVSSLSTVSWLWACYVGVARNWNFTIDFWDLISYYMASWLLTMILVVVYVTSFAKETTK